MIVNEKSQNLTAGSPHCSHCLRPQCVSVEKICLSRNLNSAVDWSSRRRSQIMPCVNARNVGNLRMTSLLDRSITAASNDGVWRWHAAKLRQTRRKI